MSWGNWFATRVLNGHWVVIVLTTLPSSEYRCWAIDIPRTSNRSLPISSFNPSLTTTNSASSIRQPLLSTGVCIIPMMGMGSLAKVLRSWAGTVVSQRASVHLLITSVASDSFRMLYTLPESMRQPTLAFPICEFDLYCCTSNTSYHVFVWTVIIWTT